MDAVHQSRCLVCWNVFRVSGLEEKHGGLKKYLAWKAESIERHHSFMSGLNKCVSMHNTNPDRACLRARAELDGVMVVKASKKSGMRQECDFEFVELDAWKAEHPDEELPATVDTEIELPSGELVMKEGVWVKIGAAGHHKFTRYSDTGVEQTKDIDDGQCIFTDEQQQLKRTA